MHRRTGLRKPKNYLKTWNSPDWTRRLTPRLSVGMVDEELPFGKEGGRKSWYLSLTADVDLLKTLGPVKGVPKGGKTLLLFEDDVVPLVVHLLNSELIRIIGDDIFNGPAVDWEEARLRNRKRKSKRRPGKRR